MVRSWAVGEGLSLLANLALFWSLLTSCPFTLQVLNLCVESSFHLKHFSQAQKWLGLKKILWDISYQVRNVSQWISFWSQLFQRFPCSKVLCNCSDAGISCLLKGLEKKLGVSLTKVMELFDMGCWGSKLVVGVFGEESWVFSLKWWSCSV